MAKVPSPLALSKAREQVARQFADANPNNPPHSVGIGFIEQRGKTTDQIGIVVKVSAKLPEAQLRAAGLPVVPDSIVAEGELIRIDVQQMEQPQPAILRLDNGGAARAAAFHHAFAVTTHQRCQDAPIPGGSQIAPNQPWVGTLSCGLMFRAKDGAQEEGGALTNAHVTGMNAEGGKMFQPVGGQGDPFGEIARVVDLRFGGQNQPNYIDAAVIRTFRKDGKYANGGQGLHTVSARKLIDVGELVPTPKRAALGMRVVKTGRTTGKTRGKVTMVDGTTFVNYGADGTAYFERQFFCQADSGQFSAGGDSGSLILEESTLQPVGLLYAGGGRDTIFCPIEYVLQWCGGRFV